MATISRQANRWFVSFAYKDDIIPAYETVCSNVTDSEDDIIGIDLGIKDLAITSNGMVYGNPKAYATAEKRLIRYQKRVSRRKKGSKNRKRAVMRLAIQHRKVTNIRMDCAHKTSSDIVKKLTPKVIVLETLNPKNMVRNHNLAKSLHDSNFGRLTNFIEYKSKQNNVKVVHVPMFYPSSQICSACGQYRKADLTLADREWTCPVCGEHHDRDANAARNLRYYGLWLFNHITTTVSSTESYACSRGERHDGSDVSAAVKDLRLQFFLSDEQCKSLKQDINSHYLMARYG
jgi:putative transposase